MPKLRDALDADTSRLESTMEGDNSPQAIKAARTRWENSHKTYWREVRKAWREIQQGKKGDPSSIAESHGVTLTDIAEIAGTPDPEGDTDA